MRKNGQWSAIGKKNVVVRLDDVRYACHSLYIHRMHILAQQTGAAVRTKRQCYIKQYCKKRNYYTCTYFLKQL